MVKFTSPLDNFFYESLCKVIQEVVADNEDLTIIHCSVYDSIKFFKSILTSDCYLYCLEHIDDLINEQLEKLDDEKEKETD